MGRFLGQTPVLPVLSWKSNTALQGLGRTAQLLRETRLRTAHRRPWNLMPQATIEPSVEDSKAAGGYGDGTRGRSTTVQVPLRRCQKTCWLEAPNHAPRSCPKQHRMARRDCTQDGTKQVFRKLLEISQLMTSFLFCLGPSLQLIPGFQQDHDASTLLCLHSQPSAPSLLFPLPKKQLTKKKKKS